MTEAREPADATEAAPTAGQPTSQPAPIDPGTAWSPAPVESTAPVSPAAAPGSRNRTRWIVAGLVVVLVVGITIGAGILLSGRSTPEALGYIPSSMTVVGEARMDLPGDQLQKVGNLLAHFPGFKDQSTLPQKIDQALSKLVTGASSGSVDYMSQVKPWVGGPTFLAGDASTTTLASPAASGATGAMAPEGLIVTTTDGTAKCESVLPASASPATSTYQGVTILATADGTRACAINGRIALLGSAGLVKAALDAHAAHNGMDTDATYRTARDTLGGDRLATLYLSKAFLASSLRAGSGPSATIVPVPSVDLQAALGALPAWMMFGVNAEDDALVADFVSAPFNASAASAAAGSPLPSVPPAHASRTATLLPANTLALVDVHGAGIALTNAVTTLKDNPSLGSGLGQIDTTLGALGGVDQLVGWVDDAGLAVVPDGSGVTGGVLLTTSDEATASAKVGQLKSLVALAGAGSANVQVHDETVAGVTMTVVDLGDLGPLLQGAGGPTLPIPAGQHVVVAFAAKGSAVIAGGDAFVRSVLGVSTGGSLVDAAGYKHALGRATAENVSEIYVGTASILALADTMLPADQKASFDTNTKPYLDPFDAMLMTTTLEHGAPHLRIVATVK